MPNKVLWVGLFLVFWAVGIYRLDPDFGWHVRMGQVISELGVPKADPFSYTMPSFEFVDHEWLTNVLMYRIYESAGMVGLAAVFAILTVGMLVVAVPARWGRWGLIPTLLAVTILLPRGGVRPQVEDWLFLAVVVRLFANREAWRRWRWVVPVGMGVWANLHGGFAVGVAVLVFGVVVRAWEEKRLEGKEIMVVVLAGLATLVNPYGSGLWYEVWMQMTDTNLRWNIAEWQPFFANMEMGFGFLATMILALGLKVWREMVWWKLGLVGVMFGAGLSSLRHQALFAVVGMPVLAESLERLYLGVVKDEVTKRRAEWFFGVLLAIAGVLAAWEVGWAEWGIVRGMGTAGGFYPKKAVEYLRQREIAGNMFSNYGWGGYLIWQMPEKKVFIDGRMPSWRYSVPGFRIQDSEVAKGESKWAFEEYLKVTNGGEYEEIFEKYDVRVVLWPREREDRLERWLNDRLDKWGWRGKEKEKKKGLVERLAEGGWKKEYEDNAAVIYSDGGMLP